MWYYDHEPRARKCKFLTKFHKHATWNLHRVLVLTWKESFVLETTKQVLSSTYITITCFSRLWIINDNFVKSVVNEFEKNDKRFLKYESY